MATARATLPDGRVLNLEISEGNTEDQIRSFVSGRFPDVDASGISIDIARERPRMTEAQVEAERQRLRTQIASDVGPIEAALIGVGRGVTTIGRAFGLAEPEEADITESFAELERQRPISTTVGEIAGQSAPFLIPGLGAPAAATRLGGGALARAGVAGALGAAEGAAIARGEGGGLDETLFAGGVGGTTASALELALPVIGRIGGRIVRKALGKVPTGAVVDEAGRPSAEFLEALQKEGLTFDDVAQEAIETSRRAVDPTEEARMAFLESQGLQPTRAQVTRGAAEFQAQQEAAKTKSRVREALEAQEAVLTSRFDNAIVRTGGDPVTPTSGVTDVLVDKASELDAKIGQLYNQAREIAPGEKNIKFNSLTKKLKDLAPANRRTGGAIETIVGDMKSKGILDEKFNVVGRVDVETAEDLRKLTNELFDPQNNFANAKLREIKDSLDDDVFRAAGKDVFQEARKAKSDFDKGLSRAKISKFDSRKRNLVRDVLENKIDPDDFANKVVFGKSYRASDLDQLKNYITDGTGEAGEKAFNDLRSEVLQTIKDKSFIGPLDQAGNRALSRDKLQKAISSIGREKINVLFTPDEQKFLKDMVKVAELREPVRGTAIGRGPTAQAIKKLEDKLVELPILGGMFEFSARGALKGKPRPVVQTVSPSAARSLISQPVAALTAQQAIAQEQQ
jgi:hypothetical protein